MHEFFGQLDARSTLILADGYPQTADDTASVMWAVFHRPDWSRQPDHPTAKIQIHLPLPRYSSWEKMVEARRILLQEVGGACAVSGIVCDPSEIEIVVGDPANFDLPEGGQ
jgi:hypothetical protein